MSDPDVIEIVETPPGTVSIVESTSQDTVPDVVKIVEDEAVDVVVITDAGITPGPQGRPGASGGGTAQIVSSIPIGGHRAVAVANNGAAVYADNATRYKTVMGVSTGASEQGAMVDIQTFGKMMEPSWNWDVSKGLFLGSNGLLVQDVPESGAIVSMGFVIDHETIFISIEAFIERG